MDRISNPILINEIENLSLIEYLNSELVPSLDSNLSPDYCADFKDLHVDLSRVDPSMKESVKRLKSKRLDKEASYVKVYDNRLSPDALEFKPSRFQVFMKDQVGSYGAVASRSNNDASSIGAFTQIVNGGVKTECPCADCDSLMKSRTIKQDQLNHIIEIYDFPRNLRKSELMSAYQAYCSRSDIKWVDETHALVVFRSEEIAAKALAVCHPNIKSRPISLASVQSKCKARAVSEYLLPFKPRPATCTAPARRLLQQALGSERKIPTASKADQDRLKEARKRKDIDRRKRRGEYQVEDERYEVIADTEDITVLRPKYQSSSCERVPSC